MNEVGESGMRKIVMGGKAGGKRGRIKTMAAGAGVGAVAEIEAGTMDGTAAGTGAALVDVAAAPGGTALVVEMWPVERVRPYAGNPRNNEAAVKAVAASIREFGFLQPIVVDGEGVIIVGHTRRLAAILLGLATVPVHVARNLTAAQVKAYRIADNKLGELAEWDNVMLELELQQLAAMPGKDGAAYDLAVLGFEAGELARLQGMEPEIRSEWPELGEPESQIFTIRYGREDVAVLRKFCGDETLDLTNGRAGVKILERIRETTLH